MTAKAYQIAGTHYKDMGVEPWDVIDGCFSREEAIGYYRGNALKYIMRMGRKGPALVDARKAKHYLEKLVEVLEQVEMEAKKGDKDDRERSASAWVSTA